ncbi:MAG: YlxR family protein [Christensenellaceae bacterium]|jgi:predicted RNA-binding protein YlxR (DUF448 family)|nr:YlxR family protein [Christensenellaceae bacterium]
MPQKKIPLRMCVGCREMRPKKELIRIVRGQDGAVAADPTGKAQGRGAYLCGSAACLEKAQKTRALERALDSKIGAEVFERLREQLKGEDAAHE